MRMKSPFLLVSLLLIALTDGSSLEEKVKEVQKELGEYFSVEKVEDLFIVASNDSKANTERAKGTVTHTFRAMYKEFMEKKPTESIKVYLFRDKESYDKYNKDAYGRKPSTPYGFYMSSERKMVMNIATGTGTLAHEMVHPLIATDFPNVPSWFNEGFASLCEQSRFLDNGFQRGLVNWRLTGLQKALKNGDEVSLKTVMETTTNGFYGENSGLNYAIARYLCLYLQEKEKLPQFYREYKSGFKDDKSGVKTLEKILGQPLDDIEKDWKSWVKKLKF